VYFLCQEICNYLQRLLGRGGAALGAVPTDLKAGDHDVKSAIALDLAFKAVEQVALELHDFATAKTSHVNVIALRTTLIEMLFALHVHEVEFINQSVALEQVERPVHGHTVDPGIQPLGVAQDLRRIQVLLCRFHDAKDGPTLMSKANSAGGQNRLQPSWRFGFRQWHRVSSIETVLQ
jgi:hypothetical protein